MPRIAPEAADRKRKGAWAVQVTGYAGGLAFGMSWRAALGLRALAVCMLASRLVLLAVMRGGPRANHTTRPQFWSTGQHLEGPLVLPHEGEGAMPLRRCVFGHGMPCFLA